MPQARDQAGNIWDVTDPNNPVLVSAASQGAQPLTYGTPDPTIATKEARAQAADARAQAAQNRLDETAQREAIKFAAEYNPDGTKKPQAPALTAKERADAIAAYTTANQMDKLIADMEAKFNDGPGSTKGLMGAQDFLPTESNKQFDKAGQAVRGQVGTLLGFTGGQLNSVKEAEMAVGPYIPQSNEYDATALDKIQRLKELSNLARERSVAILGGVPDANGRITPIDPNAQKQDNKDAPPTLANPQAGNGGPPASPWNDNGGGGTTIASGATRTVQDDKIAKQIDAMMNAGASKAMIDTVLKQQGMGPISPSDYTAAKKWMKDNPGKAYYGARSDKQQEMSYLQRLAGSKTGSFLANMADAATAGTSTALAGDQGRAALEAMNAVNPNQSVGGSLVGGILGAGAAEGMLAARAPAALARFAPRIADTAYGALSGFNGASEGQGAQGALTGGLGALAGGAVGERAMRGVGAVARGVTDPAVQRLRDLGVPMTVGQVVRNGGVLGRTIGKLEEAAASIPLVGSQVAQRFDDGLRGVNRAAFDIGAETTGNQVQDIGSAGIGQLRQLVGDQYDRALNGVNVGIPTDPGAVADISAALARTNDLPQVGRDAADALRYRIEGGTDDAGNMSGRDFQEAYRGLARDGRAAANGPYAHEFAGIMRDGQDALAGALERQNPGAFGQFVDANTANRRTNVLADAVNAAKNRPDGVDIFTPAQLNTADANSATRLTGRLNSASGNRPFYQLATDAQQVMGNRLPNSGTADRGLAALALGGLGGAGVGAASGDTETGTATGLGAALALIAGGSRAGQELLTGAILARPALLRSLGGRTELQSRLGGAIGTGVSPLLVSPP